MPAHRGDKGADTLQLDQQPEIEQQPVRIYIGGMGGRRDRTCSGYAWVNSRSRRKLIKEIPELRKIEAEWLALHSAVSHVRPRGRTVEIVTSTPLLVAQFEERVPVSGPRSLMSVVARTFNLIHDQSLTVTVVWLPGSENPAAKRLRAALAERRACRGVLEIMDRDEPLNETAEHGLKREHVAASPEPARRNGTKSGRPVGRPRVVVPLQQIKELRKQGLGWRRTGRKLGISPTTARRAYLQSEE